MKSLEEELQLIHFIVSAFLSLWCIVANIILLALAIKSGRTKYPIYILICAAALVDIVYSVILPGDELLSIYYASNYLTQSYWSREWCEIWGYISEYLYTLIMYHHIALALNRYLCLARPTSLCTRCCCCNKPRWPTVLTVWLLAAAWVGIPKALEWGGMKYNPWWLRCHHDSNLTGAYPIYMASRGYITCFLLLLSYLLIFCNYRRLRKTQVAPLQGHADTDGDEAIVGQRAAPPPNHSNNIKSPTKRTNNYTISDDNVGNGQSGGQIQRSSSITHNVGDVPRRAAATPVDEPERIDVEDERRSIPLQNRDISSLIIHVSKVAPETDVVEQNTNNRGNETMSREGVESVTLTSRRGENSRDIEEEQEDVGEEIDEVYVNDEDERVRLHMTEEIDITWQVGIVSAMLILVWAVDTILTEIEMRQPNILSTPTIYITWLWLLYLAIKPLIFLIGNRNLETYL